MMKPIKPLVRALCAAFLFTLAPAVEAVNISGVNNLLAAGRNDGNVQMFNADTGASLGDFDASGGSGEIGELLYHNNQWYGVQGGGVYRWDLDGTVDESNIVIEPEQLMRAFNKQHPRPEHAIKANQAAKAFDSIK